MGKLIDLTGMVFGRLTVLRHVGKNEKGENMWECQCECGNTVAVRGDVLRYGLTRSCGCLSREVHADRCRTVLAARPSPKLKDLTGRVFGRLTVIRRLTEEEGARRGQPKWLCQCECGRQTTPLTASLLSGKTKSCGCLGLENATKAKIKHGDALSKKKTPLYGIWAAMLRRCENPNVSSWKYYGGKGVKVCEAWHDYIAFREWAVANGYAPTLTIDRIDSNGDYEPKNCRWITAFENASRAHALNSEVKKIAIELVKRGHSVAEAAREVGAARITVSRWCAGYGIKPPKWQYPEAFRQLVLCLRREGVPVMELIEMAGIGHTTYTRWIKGETK